MNFKHEEYKMASINIVGLKGKITKISSKLLGDNYAQTATNCTFESGQLTPLKNSEGVGDGNFLTIVHAIENTHVSSSDYYIGDIIYYSTTELNYICIQNHTSTLGTNYPDDTNGSQFWQIVDVYAIDDSGTTWVTEVSDIICDAASNLTASGAGDYIKYYTNDLNIYIWFDVDSGNTDPKLTDTNLNGFYGIEIDVAAGDTAAQVATKISTVLSNYTDGSNDYEGLWSVKSIVTSTTVRLTHKYEGSLTDINIGTVSGGSWAVNINTQGVGGNYIIINGGLETIYLLNDSWLTFGSTVDIVKSTIPDNNYRIYYTGDAFPKQTDYDEAIVGSSENWPTTKYRLGVEQPSGTLTTGTTPGDIGADITTAYVYTYITASGEEGKPSDPSDIRTILASENLDITLTGFDYPTKDLNNITHVRIYRINAGDTLAEYQLVNTESDLAIATAVTSGYTDSKDPSELGEVISTTDYDIPPDEMVNIVMYGNGIYAGFKNNDIYFNEPFLPYAWPSEYRVNIAENNIIGLGAMGGGVVALTDGNPRIILGNHPANMVETPLPYNQPCLSKDGIVSSKFGVTYPTTDGLYHITSNDGINLTENIYSISQWNLLGTLADLFGVFHDGKYYGFFKNSSIGFIYDFDNPDYIIDISHPILTFINGYSTGTNLYVLALDGNIESVYDWATANTNLTYTWKSKKFQKLEYINLSVGRVIGDGTCTFKLYVDGNLKQTKGITMDKLFRLPSGFRGKTYEVEITGTGIIDIIQLGTSVKQLGV